jgi:hypothetical protein
LSGTNGEQIEILAVIAKSCCIVGIAPEIYTRVPKRKGVVFLVANEEGIDRDPQGTNRSFGYHSGMTSIPGGAVTIWGDVTPGSKRITGQTENARAQRDSISRQYDTTPAVHAVA